MALSRQAYSLEKISFEKLCADVDLDPQPPTFSHNWSAIQRLQLCGVWKII